MRTADRAYTDEELDHMATPLSIHLERAAEARDGEAIPWIVEQMNMECLNIYDAYVSWMGVLQKFVFERGGETAHDRALTFSAEHGVRPFVHDFAGLGARERALRVARRLRASGSTFEVEEDERRVRFRVDPWGGIRWWRQPYGWEGDEPRRRDGDRILYPCYGYYDEPNSFAMLSGARPLTQGRETLPSFLANEVQFLELIPIEVMGMPIAAITFGETADDASYLDVYKDPADIPAELYASLGSVKPSGGLPGESRSRVFSNEELARLGMPLSIQVEQAAADRDWDRLREIAAGMDVELVSVKDSLGIVIAGMLSWIAWHQGEDAAEEALERTAEVVMAPYVGAVRALTPTEGIPMWAMVWRAHGSTFWIEEDPEKFVFRGRPLGACHRMWSHAYQKDVERISDGRVRYPTFGSYDPPVGLHRLHEPRKISRGRSNYPIYSCHCHMLHTIYPIDQIGHPLWVEEHPLEDPDGETIHLHYKDPSDWPDLYYEEVERSRPKPAEA